jgi:hypothetical protein
MPPPVSGLRRSQLGHFDLVLTDRERQLLEEISADLEETDPRFAARIGGWSSSRWRDRWRRSQPIVAAAAIPGGLAVTIATFPWSTPVAFAGVGAAFWGCNVHAERAGSWVVATSRRLRNWNRKSDG